MHMVYGYMWIRLVECKMWCMVCMVNVVSIWCSVWCEVSLVGVWHIVSDVTVHAVWCVVYSCIVLRDTVYGCILNTCNHT